MQKLTSKDKEGRILVNGIYKACNIASDCSFRVVINPYHNPFPTFIHCKKVS